MRAVVIEQPGDPSVLAVKEWPVRAAGKGEVRIRVKAAAVNPTDVLVRERGAGKTPAPWIPGMDAAGTIESVGEGVDRLAVGDEVMATCSPQRPEGGAQVELLVVPAASVVKIPDGASHAQASTLPMNGLTALLGLEQLGLKPGQTLAVSGGAGLLAYYVIVLAKKQGLRVIADAKPSEVELVRGYGADVVVARGDAFCDEVLAAAPGGVDGLYDTALLHETAFPVIKDGGGIAVVRGWDGRQTPRGIVVHAVMVFSVLQRTEWLEYLRDLASKGDIHLRVAGEYPVSRVADAQIAMDAGGLRGRAVLMF